MITLPQDILAGWLIALRSGVYAQGTTYLENRDAAFRPRWTALGLLARMIEAPCTLDNDVVTFNFSQWVGHPVNSQTVMPAGVAGLSQDFIDAVAAMNATHTFAAIATYIEANVRPAASE